MSCCIIGCPNEGASASKDTTYHLFPHPEKDKTRFKKWLEACSNSRIQKMDEMSVHKRYRICRRHFDSDCLNGGCRRLLNTAIPTLYLNSSGKLNVDSDESTLITPDGNIVYVPVAIGIDDTDEHFELVLTEDNKTANDVKVLNANVHSACKRKSEELSLQKSGHKYGYLKEIHTKHKIKRLKPEIDHVEHEEGGSDEKNLHFRKENIAEITNENHIISVVNEEIVSPPESKLNVSQELEMQYELLDVEDDKFYKVPLTHDTFNKWRNDFYKCEKNVLAQNVCSRIDPFEAALSRKVLETTQHVYTYKVESEGKPLTNQKNSGRCWLFAALNSIRIPFMKNYNLDEFEFSQTYLFYWDKIERCHYFLNNIIETAAKGEEVTGRLVSFLLHDPTCDGGQWDMVVNLIKKHGLMPKKCYPETYCSEASVRMNAILKSKLREYSKILRDLVAAGNSEDEVRAKLNEQMGEIYRVVGICLGIPDETFTWEYYDKSKTYHCIKSIQPIDFYEKYVKPYFDVDDKVCIVTDPRPTNTYGQAYTVEYLGNVVGGRPVLYNNQPVEILMELVTNSLKNAEPVWFGCEVSKRFAAKQGIEDLTVHDFKLLLGVDIQITLSKADRMIYGESAMTHAMTFTAVSCDDDGNSTKFRVENSWGEDRGEKGYLTMSADWFKEFVFEIVVDKSIVPKDVLEVFNQTPIVLPAWDPMGTLAKN